MFEESLLESAHLIRPQSRWTTVVSFGIQAAIAAVIITIPLLHPHALVIHAAEVTLAPPPHDPPKPPAPERVRVEATETSGPTAPSTAQQQSPPQIPRGSLNPNAFSDDPPATGMGINMARNGNPLATLGPSTTTGPAISVAPKAGPLNVSTGVGVGLLLAPIRPVYPPIAIAAHQQGAVIIHAIISKTGRIESASAESGPMMLQQAALDAVRAARYRPYMLNGSPTEVETTFDINFRLNQ